MTDFNTLDALSEGVVSRRAGLRSTQRTMARLYGSAAEGLGFTGALFARDVINQAAEKVTERVTEEMRLFAQAMADKSARNRDNRVTRIHEVAGQLAVAATVRSYERNRAKRRKAARLIRNPDTPGSVGSRSRAQPRLQASTLRVDRFAGGKLGRALASSNMYDARWDGVAFINRRWLDSQAKQWYRLSFGAGARGKSTPPHRDYNIRFFGSAVFSMSLKAFGPSASFSMPAGLWFGFDGNPSPAASTGDGNVRPGAPSPARRGQDQFVPGSFGGRAFRGRRTQGIQGTAFLDAGVAALTRSLGEGWSVLMTEWFEEAAVQQTGPVAAIGVSPRAAARGSAKLQSELRDMNVDFSRWKSTFGR